MTEPIIHKLMEFIALQAAGCPIGRHELTNEEWKLLGAVKAEFEKIVADEAEQRLKDKKS